MNQEDEGAKSSTSPAVRSQAVTEAEVGAAVRAYSVRAGYLPLERMRDALQAAAAIKPPSADPERVIALLKDLDGDTMRRAVIRMVEFNDGPPRTESLRYYRFVAALADVLAPAIREALTEQEAGTDHVAAAPLRCPSGLPDLDALQKLAEAATPGPWEAVDFGGEFVAPYCPDGGPLACRAWESDAQKTLFPTGMPAAMRSDDDARFIAAANPQTVLALIAAIRGPQAEAAQPRPAEPSLSQPYFDELAARVPGAPGVAAPAPAPVVEQQGDAGCGCRTAGECMHYTDAEWREMRADLAASHHSAPEQQGDAGFNESRPARAIVDAAQPGAFGKWWPSAQFEICCEDEGHGAAREAWAAVLAFVIQTCEREFARAHEIGGDTIRMGGWEDACDHLAATFKEAMVSHCDAALRDDFVLAASRRSSEQQGDALLPVITPNTDSPEYAAHQAFANRWYKKYEHIIDGSDASGVSRGYLALAALKDGWFASRRSSPEQQGDADLADALRAIAIQFKDRSIIMPSGEPLAVSVLMRRAAESLASRRSSPEQQGGADALEDGDGSLACGCESVDGLIYLCNGHVAMGLGSWGPLNDDDEAALTRNATNSIAALAEGAATSAREVAEAIVKRALASRCSSDTAAPTGWRSIESDPPEFFAQIVACRPGWSPRVAYYTEEEVGPWPDDLPPPTLWMPIPDSVGVLAAAPEAAEPCNMCDTNPNTESYLICKTCADMVAALASKINTADAVTGTPEAAGQTERKLAMLDNEWEVALVDAGYHRVVPRRVIPGDEAEVHRASRSDALRAGEPT
jgi:hypothetical protein